MPNDSIVGGSCHVFDFIQSLPHAIFVANPQGVIIKVNKEFETTFGYDDNEVIGENVDILIPGTFRVAKKEWMVDSLKNPKSRQFHSKMEFHGLHKNGTEFPADIDIWPFETGEGVTFLGALRERTPEALDKDTDHESENRFNAFFNLSPPGLAIFDEHLRFVIVNRTLAAITRLPAAQHSGKTIRQVLPDVDALNTIDKRLKQALAGETVLNEEVAYEVPRLGLKRTWLVSYFPISEGGNKIMNVGACVLDISEHKKTEDELRKAYTEIELLKNQLHGDNHYLRQEIKSRYNFEEIIGRSPELEYVLYKVNQVAPTGSTVLLLGETGTGKELFARAIHNSSPRKDRPLLKVNCAALPANLIESELFGHEKGAFTGASTRKIGWFEHAHGATIFLDEIGDLPFEKQEKLLRVLQEGEFERLGSTRTVKADVRVIAATNRNMEEEVKKGHFRPDLYYRLNVYPITVPPLRNRREDIPLLVQPMIVRMEKRLGKRITMLSERTMRNLQNYAWPGNIRELENVIERAMITTPDGILRVELPDSSDMVTPENRTLASVEQDYIVGILERTDWRIEGPGGAAQVLGLNASTLRGRMRKLGIARS